MKLAGALLVGGLSLAPLQDEWKPLALASVAPAPAPIPATDTTVAPEAAPAVGLTLTPGPGTIDLLIGIDNPCQAKITASQQPHGAVVKVRIMGPPTDRKCPGQKIEMYKASVTGLKKKQYQVVVYTADAKNHWRPWKAGVTDVP